MRTIILLFMALVLVAGCSAGKDWRTASRDSAGLAPDPRTTPEAVLQVYGASTWGWRGWFAIHTWILCSNSRTPKLASFLQPSRWRSSRSS